MKIGTTMFTYASDPSTIELVVILPDNVCYEGNTSWFLNRIIRPSEIGADKFAFLPMPLPSVGKIKKAAVMEMMRELSEFFDAYGEAHVLCGTADVYKHIVDTKKSGGFIENIGRAVPNKTISQGSGKKKEVFFVEDTFKVVPLLNPVIIEMYPHKISEVKKGLSVAKALLEGTYSTPTGGIDNIKVNKIVQDPEEALAVMKKLFKADKLFVDIETTGLKWQSSKLLTVSFAVSEKEAYCFPLHLKYYERDEEAGKSVRNIVSQFFKKYTGTFIGHNWIGFDQAYIVHELLRNEDFTVPVEEFINSTNLGDTMLMAYILYNSTERPSIGLKQLSYKWMGNYDADIDQRNLFSAPLDKVAVYNNYDVIATAKVYDELWKEIVEQGFEDVYNEYVDIGKQLLKIKMNGMRIDREGTKRLYEELEKSIKEDKATMLLSPYVQQAQVEWAKIKARKYKQNHPNKEVDYHDFIEEFNPGSPNQKRLLFFEVMQLPVLKVSKQTKEPSSDKDVMKEWLNSPEVSDNKKDTIIAISEYQLAQKIRSTYLANMLDNSIEVLPNDWRIFANYNQTSTISGRLSSSGDINLQTIPASSKYGKAVKRLFIAPDGFVIASADYSALEDRLIANESKDPNKIAIFKDGIDGHSLNAIAYFPDEMPDIVEKLKYFEEEGLEYVKVTMEDGSVEYFCTKDPEYNDSMKGEKISREEYRVGVINSVKYKYPKQRQGGKAYTFGFSYGAGPQKYGEELYNNYWKLYSGVKKYSEEKIEEARENGYLVSKFSGLRVWLPAIESINEYIRAKEERVAVNFTIQSGNFLTLRAINTLQKRIESMGLTNDVKIINTVHDSIVLVIREDPKLIELINKELISAMCDGYDKDAPVPLEAEMDIGKNLVDTITLPNNCSEEHIEEVLKELQTEKGEQND